MFICLLGKSAHFENKSKRKNIFEPLAFSGPVLLLKTADGCLMFSLYADAAQPFYVSGLSICLFVHENMFFFLGTAAFCKIHFGTRQGHFHFQAFKNVHNFEKSILFNS